MIVQFKKLYLQKLFEDNDVSGKPKYEKAVITKFKKTILMLQYAENIQEIKTQKGLNFEGLKSNTKDYFSVRIDYEYRLILTLNKEYKIEINEIIMIHDMTNHYR